MQKQIENIPLSQIKLDPNQPRKLRSEDVVRALAESIKREGIINPVELDAKGIIVTGETRYRAAILAGLKTIPAVRVERNENTLMRQLAENVHRGELNPLDLARSFHKLREKHGWDDTRMGKELGLKPGFIGEHLLLLAAPGHIIKALKEGKLNTTTASILRQMKHGQDEAFKGLLAGTIKPKQLKELVGYLNRTKDVAAIKLVMGLSLEETVNFLRKRNPNFSEKFRQALRPGQEIITLASSLALALSNVELQKIDKLQLERVGLALHGVLDEVKRLKPHVKNL